MVPRSDSGDFRATPGPLKAANVELRIGQSNLASQRVAAKAGFTREGIVRSHLPATGETYDDVLFTLR